MFKRRRYKACVVVLFAVSLAANALAQDQNNPDILKKELADALSQLKAAQDRKNELATENEKLKAQVAAIQKEADECHRAAAAFAEQTYILRSQSAAWNIFLDRYPRLKTQWDLFLSAAPSEVINELPVWTDPNPPPTIPTTPPTTAPASDPSGASGRLLSHDLNSARVRR